MCFIMLLCNSTKMAWYPSVRISIYVVLIIFIFQKEGEKSSKFNFTCMWVHCFHISVKKYTWHKFLSEKNWVLLKLMKQNTAKRIFLLSQKIRNATLLWLVSLFLKFDLWFLPHWGWHRSVQICLAAVCYNAVLWFSFLFIHTYRQHCRGNWS